MFEPAQREQYRKNQIINVVCQLRFPTILAISAREPDQFQDAIRKEFPQYQLKKEHPAPKLVNRGGVVRPEQQGEVLNHTFRSADGNWTVNLTNCFIALSAPVYRDWETFAGKLDRVLAAFFAVYQPAYFERIGLRYVNGFSKEELGVEHLRWRDLIQPSFVGLLDEDDCADSDFHRCTQDSEFRGRSGCKVKLHTGPGMVNRHGVQEKKARFILDIDVFMDGQIALNQLTGALQTVHIHAENLFRSAITDELRNAMEPY